MGPVVVFDKSFLQSLNPDDSVWFDQYFVPVITPLFFVETLADLEKKPRAGKTAEDEVGAIAHKSPEFSGSPTMHHLSLCNGELHGLAVPMEGKPVLGGGQRIADGDREGFHFDISREAAALERWRQRQFWEVERLYAKEWRDQLAAPKPGVGDDFLRWAGNRLKECKTIESVLMLARSLVDQAKSYDLMKFVFETLNITEDRDLIFMRYQVLGAPPFRQLFPYTTHVIDVEIFCRLAISRGLISGDRPSNRIDIAYLHYLPFCQFFVSGDHLHRLTAPLFLRDRQEFVWGPHLRDDLKRINALHADVPDETRRKGIRSFAPYPPTEGDFLTSKLWDRMNNQWRTPMKLDLTSPQMKEIIDRALAMKSGTPGHGSSSSFDFNTADSVIIERKMRVKKGSWYQLPSDLQK